MSDAVVPPTRRFQFKSVLDGASTLGWLLLRVFLLPLRVMLAIRRSATASSVSLLLVGIVTLNILWGYPWVGIFSACFSMMLIGLAVNWFMMPKLTVDFSLPRSVESGHSFSLLMHLKNRRSLPALQLSASFDKKELRSLFRERRLFAKDAPRENRRRQRYELNSDPVSIPVIGPGERASVEASLRFLDRGIHPLPRVCIRSHFPFCLFESTTLHPSQATIAVTPRLIDESNDTVAAGHLSDLSLWVRRCNAFEAYDYVGSREYQTGMPVRRWDFSSWARLGRPIIREFQSPGSRTAVIVVDTAANQPSSPSKVVLFDEGVERVLSLAATAITQLNRQRVEAQLITTDEANEEWDSAVGGVRHSSEIEAMLIQLAQAQVTLEKQADERLREIAEQFPNLPYLLITSRQTIAVECRTPQCQVIRVDMGSDFV
ncbi:hypothetical protein Q31b_05660 [Novipirellula aureliae]|uniref:DUF58 domain-containing protein n=1 Tax=Novipirellula aureliae TaxID=2527966 RepID=A0A5C6EA73_9BACT|nr:DUF58 domain-containing protein [Novipirellula aureliae]TWU45394.1 hypothetical protein Q31b_05660 [Novipirellula aureliae]